MIKAMLDIVAFDFEIARFNAYLHNYMFKKIKCS